MHPRRQILDCARRLVRCSVTVDLLDIIDPNGGLERMRDEIHMHQPRVTRPENGCRQAQCQGHADDGKHGSAWRARPTDGSRSFGLIGGKWKNMGEDHCHSVEAARAGFDEKKYVIWSHFRHIKKSVDQEEKKKRSVSRQDSKTTTKSRAATRKVLLPSASMSDAEVILDLASGKILAVKGSVKDFQDFAIFDKLGKGDLLFDRFLGCIRGGKAKMWDGKRFVDMPPDFESQDITSYKLPSVPCRLLLTTAEKKHFDVKILSVTDKGGINLEYCEAAPDLMQPEAVTFGPVVESVLHKMARSNGSRTAELLDLDTQRRATMQKFGHDDSETHRWIRGQKVDVMGGMNKGGAGLLLFDACVIEIPNTQWQKISASEIDNHWALRQMEPKKISMLPSGKDSKQSTCIFKTREGGLGLLQIVGPAENGKDVNIRYQLVKKTRRIGRNRPQLGYSKCTQKSQSGI